MNIIETDRLMVRQYSNTDIPELHKILSNPITMSFWPAPFTLQQTESWVISNIVRYHELGFGRWSILLKETNEVTWSYTFLYSPAEASAPKMPLAM